MGKLALKWGGISGAIMMAFLLASHILYPTTDPSHFDIAEVFGYAAMVVSLAVLYLAMQELEKTNGDIATTLWQRVLVGTMASLVAGVIFGLYNVAYSTVINPEFLDTYYNYYISQLPVQSGPEYERMVAELEADKAMFMHPFTQFTVMGSTVVMLGIPISVLLAFVHKLRS